MKSISILGCGWLGLPLAKEFLNNNWKVTGSTTSLEKVKILEKEGINAHAIDLPAESLDTLNEFNDSEVLFINIPPKLKLNEPEFHLKQISQVLETCKAEALKKIVFISSTSVYPLLNKEVTEQDADPEHTLVKAENMIISFCKQNNLEYLILRMGGLMGFNRIPCKYFAGWKALKTGDLKVNFIHRDDAVGVINALLNSDISNQIFNVVCPEKPTRQELYKVCTKATGLEMPEFLPSVDPQDFKIISGKKLMDHLNYSFKYNSPLVFPFI